MKTLLILDHKQDSVVPTRAMKYTGTKGNQSKRASLQGLVLPVGGKRRGGSQWHLRGNIFLPALLNPREDKQMIK